MQRNICESTLVRLKIGLSLLKMSERSLQATLLSETSQ